MQDTTMYQQLLKRVVAAATILGVGAAGFVLAAPATAHAPLPPEPVVHYTMDGIDGTTVPDSSGHGHDGTVVGTGATEVVGADDGTALDLPGGFPADGAPYITFPSDVLESAESLTVSIRVWWDGVDNWEPVFSIGASEQRYLGVIARTGPDFGSVLRAGITRNWVDSEAQTVGSDPLPDGRWATVTVVLDADQETLTTYLDGVEQASVATDISASELYVEDEHGGRIGGSALGWDRTFQGAIDDVLVFDAALTAEQVAGLPRVDMLDPDLHYTMDGIDGTVVADSSGNGYHGTLVGSGAAVDGEGAASALQLNGGHVTIPGAIIDGATDLTFSAKVRWDGGGEWQRIVDLGTNTTRYLFVTPSNGSAMRAAITTGGAGGESLAEGFSSLAVGEWSTVTVTLDTDAGELTLYLDGVAVASETTSIAAGDLVNSGAGLGGYLGRSFYADPTFQGAYEDVRIYRTALTPAQVQSLAGPGVPQIESLETTTFQVRTRVDEAPVLPAAAPALFTDGYVRNVSVDWDDVDPSDYAQTGSFTVHGVAAGFDVTAEVTVHRGELRVDLATHTGDFMGGAAGLLYGLYGDGMPTENLIEGMKIRSVATKAQDGSQHPGSDALEILGTLADTTGGDVYLRTTDYYRGFPYQVPGANQAERRADYARVTNEQLDMIEQYAARGADERRHVSEHLVIEPFNEPEGNMFSNRGNASWTLGPNWLSNPGPFFETWDETYRTIRAWSDRTGIDLRIAGIGGEHLWPQTRGFLEHAVAEDTVPDIITWHELSHPQAIRESVATFRDWEEQVFAGTAYDGIELPININEYAFNYHTSVPGQMIQWISAIEDSKVDAMIAFWNINGNLSDSAVQTNRGNGQWWLYNAYAGLTGQTVEVVPPEPGVNYSLQGLATLDDSSQQARALIGGADGSAAVDFVNVPEGVFGNTVRVWVKEIPWTGQLGDSPAPEVLAEAVVPVDDGVVSIEFGQEGLPELVESSAYEIIVTPAGGSADGEPTAVWSASYEAEDAGYRGSPRFHNGPEGSPSNVAGFHTSGGYNIGGLRTGSTLELDFEVTVPEDGEYDLQIFSSTYNQFAAVQDQGPTNVFVRVNGADEQEVFLPLSYKWVVWDHADTTVNLTGGTHTITLAAASDSGSGATQGDAIVDRIRLAKAVEPGTFTAYEAEHAEFTSGVSYAAGASGSGVVNLGAGESATFWVYGPEDAEASLEVDGTGTGDVQVNGQRVFGLADTSAAAVHLYGGINKVVVTGPADVDRLLVGESEGLLEVQEIQAEDAILSGDAEVVELSLAEGGLAVTSIGGEPGNDSTVTFEVDVDDAGTHAVVVRFSNPEQVPATHYNPNPMARRALISVNGGDPDSVLFVPTFHENNFWERTVLLELDEGENTITIGSEEQPNFDGVTYAQDDWPGIPLRADTAPILDRITVSPIVVVGDGDGDGNGDGNGDDGNGGGTTDPGKPDESDLLPSLEDAVTGPPVIVRGESFTVRTTGIDGRQTVGGWLMSEPVSLGTATLAQDGTAVFTVPMSAPLGEHRFVLTDAEGAVLGWYAVTVADAATDDADDDLALSGTDVLWSILPWALLLAVAGGVLVLMRRRE